MKTKIKQMVFFVLQKFGWKKLPPAFMTDNKEFMHVYNQIKSHALLSTERAFFLFQFSKQALALPGEIAEIGVYKGGGARLIAEIFKDKKQIYLFDTFEGMPEVDKKEDNIKAIKKGMYSDTSLIAVKNFLSKFKNIKIYKGIFPETSAPITEKKFCFVHVDTDIYKSTKDCIEFFYPRMVSGGIIICDDFKSPECKGVEKAVNDFFKNKKEFPVHTTNQQCVIIKI